METPCRSKLSHLYRLAAGLLLVGLIGVGNSALAGIADTKHNLGSSAGLAGRNQTNATEEICVFCHTPHASNTSVTAPLWNKALPASTYTMYSTSNSSTIDGTVGQPGSVSLACLSCHDGTQAMDNMINAPGSGGYNASGARYLGPSGTATWSGSTVGSGTGLMSGVAALGTDLTNDHPIGIQYCGGGLTGSGTTVSGACKDTDFKDASSGVKTASINSTQVFWVDTSVGTAGSREKTDMMLYANSAFTGPSVECASCHDPHSSTNNTFLRVSNSGSGVCLSCHVK